MLLYIQLKILRRNLKMGVFYNHMTSDGMVLTNSRDVWDFLRRKRIDDGDIYSIQETLKDCEEYVSIDIYKDKEREQKNEEDFHEIQREHLMRQITNTMAELDAINNNIRQAKRINRDRLIKAIQNVYDNLYHNT